MAFGYTYTLPTISGTHTDLPVVLREADFPTGAKDGGSSSILNGGGNLRAYTDDTKTTQLPLEVVTFVTGVAPDIEVWVKVPSASTGATIYLEADDTETAQPAFTDTFGRNAVWSDYDLVYHFAEDPSGTAPQIIDSTGNGNDLTSFGSMTSGDLIASRVGTGIEFDGSNDYLRKISGSPPTASTFALTAVVNPVSGSQYLSDGRSGSTANQRAFIYGFQTGAFNLFNNGYPTGTASDTQLTASSGSYHYVNYTTNGSTLRGNLDGSEAVNVSANLNIPGTTEDIFIGANAGPSDFSGATFDEYRQAVSYPSEDRNATESDNLLSTAAWGTVGTWADAAGGTTVTIGLVTDTETAIGVASANPRTYTLGIVTDSETALPITSVNPRSYQIGLATDTETALTITPSIEAGGTTVVIGLASDTESVLPVTPSKTANLGLPVETSEALSIAPSKTVSLGLVEETETALSVTVLNPRSYTVGIVTETETALPIIRVGGAETAFARTDLFTPISQRSVQLSVTISNSSVDLVNVLSGQEDLETVISNRSIQIRTPISTDNVDLDTVIS